MIDNNPLVYLGENEPTGIDFSKISTRFEYNKVILVIFSVLIEHYPDWRFGQLLVNIGVMPHELDKNFKGQLSDRYYEESIQILEKLLENPVVSKFFKKVEDKKVVNLNDFKNFKGKLK